MGTLGYANWRGIFVIGRLRTQDLSSEEVRSPGAIVIATIVAMFREGGVRVKIPRDKLTM